MFLENCILTETAAIELTDTLLQNLDNGDIPIAIFVDLSKAFDTLDHAILLKKTGSLRHQGHSFKVADQLPF